MICRDKGLDTKHRIGSENCEMTNKLTKGRKSVDPRVRSVDVVDNDSGRNGSKPTTLNNVT